MCTTFVNTQFSQCVFADTSRCSSIAVPINQSCALCVCYINKCDSFGFNVNTITHSPQPAPTHNCSSDGGGAFASNLLLKLWHDASARVCVWVPNVCGIDTRVRWGGGVERERASEREFAFTFAECVCVRVGSAIYRCTRMHTCAGFCALGIRERTKRIDVFICQSMSARARPQLLMSTRNL